MARLTSGTSSQPAANSAVASHHPTGLLIFQITMSSGCQSPISTISTRQDART
jgi:hypothetical protein